MRSPPRKLSDSRSTTASCSKKGQYGSEGGSTALALAAEFGQAEMARFLMGKGADKIAAGLEGDDALISAAQSVHATKVEILLERQSQK